MDADTSETERTRQSVQQAQRARATARSATAPSSRQEAAERIRNQQIEDEASSRVLARAVDTATPEAMARRELQDHHEQEARLAFSTAQGDLTTERGPPGVLGLRLA